LTFVTFSVHDAAGLSLTNCCSYIRPKGGGGVAAMKRYLLVVWMVLAACAQDPTVVVGTIPPAEPEQTVLLQTSGSPVRVGHGMFTFLQSYLGGALQVWWHSQTNPEPDPSAAFRHLDLAGTMSAIQPDFDLNFMALAGGKKSWAVAVDQGSDFSGPFTTHLQLLTPGQEESAPIDIPMSLAFRTNGDFLVFSERVVVRSAATVTVTDDIALAGLPLQIRENILRLPESAFQLPFAVEERYFLCRLGTSPSEGCVSKTDLGVSSKDFTEGQIASFMSFASMDADGNLAVAFRVYEKIGEGASIWMLFRTWDGRTSVKRLTGFQKNVGEDVRGLVPVFDGFAKLGADDWYENFPNGDLTIFSPEGEELQSFHIEGSHGKPSALTVFRGSLFVAHDQLAGSLTVTGYDYRDLTPLQTIELGNGLLPESISPPDIAVLGDRVLLQSNHTCVTGCNNNDPNDFDVLNHFLVPAPGN
jgi:hypothetical protein